MRIVIALLLFASLAGAQATEPTLPAETHAKIRDLQHEQLKLQVRALQIQNEMASITVQYNNLTTQINGLAAKAAVDGKVNPTEWSLDTETLSYKKIEKQPDVPVDKKPKP